MCVPPRLSTAARSPPTPHAVHTALTLVVAFDNITQVGMPVDAAFVYYGLVDARV